MTLEVVAGNFPGSLGAECATVLSIAMCRFILATCDELPLLMTLCF